MKLPSLLVEVVDAAGQLVRRDYGAATLRNVLRQILALFGR